LTNAYFLEDNELCLIYVVLNFLPPLPEQAVKGCREHQIHLFCCNHPIFIAKLPAAAHVTSPISIPGGTVWEARDAVMDKTEFKPLMEQVRAAG
jgi:hypothetical protein